MTVAIPSLNLLKAAIATALSAYNIVEDHPRSPADLTGTAARVVMVDSIDTAAGRYLTRGIAHPVIRFAVYANSKYTVTNTLLNLRTDLEQATLAMAGQTCTSWHWVNSIGTLYEAGLEAHYGAVEYQFNLTT